MHVSYTKNVVGVLLVMSSWSVVDRSSRPGGRRSKRTPPPPNQKIARTANISQNHRVHFIQAHQHSWNVRTPMSLNLYFMHVERSVVAAVVVVVRSEKSQNKSSPIFFSNFCPGFCPEFCSEFSPIFVNSFRASFRGERRLEKKITKNPLHFSMQNSQANTKKIFTKSFWRGDKVSCCCCCCRKYTHRKGEEGGRIRKCMSDMCTQ